MIGKFIVYESVFRDRFMARQIVGETRAMWLVSNPRLSEELDIDPTSKKKSSIDIISVHDDYKSALRISKEITELFILMNKRHDRERKQLIDSARTALPK